MFRPIVPPTLRVTGFAATAACIGFILAATASAADAHPGGANTKCPATYDLIVTNPSYCISKTGDIVEPEVERHGLSCPNGYEWLAHLCFSPATGDIVLADEDGARASRADLAGTPK